MSKQLEAYGYKEIHSLAQKSVTNFSGSLCGNMPLNLKQAEISELTDRVKKKIQLRTENNMV